MQHPQGSFGMYDQLAGAPPAYPTTPVMERSYKDYYSQAGTAPQLGVYEMHAGPQMGGVRTQQQQQQQQLLLLQQQQLQEQLQQQQLQQQLQQQQLLQQQLQQQQLQQQHLEAQLQQQQQLDHDLQLQQQQLQQPIEQQLHARQQQQQQQQQQLYGYAAAPFGSWGGDSLPSAASFVSNPVPSLCRSVAAAAATGLQATSSKTIKANEEENNKLKEGSVLLMQRRDSNEVNPSMQQQTANSNKPFNPTNSPFFSSGVSPNNPQAIELQFECIDSYTLTSFSSSVCLSCFVGFNEGINPTLCTQYIKPFLLSNDSATAGAAAASAAPAAAAAAAYTPQAFVDFKGEKIRLTWFGEEFLHIKVNEEVQGLREDTGFIKLHFASLQENIPMRVDIINREGQTNGFLILRFALLGPAAAAAAAAAPAAAAAAADLTRLPTLPSNLVLQQQQQQQQQLLLQQQQEAFGAADTGVRLVSPAEIRERQRQTAVRSKKQSSSSRNSRSNLFLRLGRCCCELPNGELN